MSWVYLIFAGIAEIGFATLLKMSNQFSKLWPSVGFMMCSALSFYCMSKAIKDIPMPIVYAVWTGIGIVGIAITEMLFFGEEISAVKLLIIAIMLMCIIGLKLV